jgi:hypothetical protein
MFRRNELEIVADLSEDERFNVAALMRIFGKKRYTIKRFLRGETRLIVSSEELFAFVDFLFNARAREFSHCFSRAEKHNRKS